MQPVNVDGTEPESSGGMTRRRSVDRGGGAESMHTHTKQIKESIDTLKK